MQTSIYYGVMVADGIKNGIFAQYRQTYTSANRTIRQWAEEKAFNCFWEDHPVCQQAKQISLVSAQIKDLLKTKGVERRFSNAHLAALLAYVESSSSKTCHGHREDRKHRGRVFGGFC